MVKNLSEAAQVILTAEESSDPKALDPSFISLCFKIPLHELAECLAKLLLGIGCLCPFCLTNGLAGILN